MCTLPGSAVLKTLAAPPCLPPCQEDLCMRSVSILSELPSCVTLIDPGLGAVLQNDLSKRWVALVARAARAARHLLSKGFVFRHCGDLFFDIARNAIALIEVEHPF